MALVHVIKWEANTHELVHKFPVEDLRLGSQLVVYPGQTAFFVKGGNTFDEFTAGTYIIKTENIPLQNKVYNLPFGGNSPFQAEVWFVNQVSLLDCKWGTASPIHIEDPKYKVIVPIRSFGQYGFNVSNPRCFIEKLVGNMPTFSTEQVVSYFRGVILSKLTAIISQKLYADSLSVINISSHIEVIASYAKERLAEVLSNYGITLESFNVIGINVNEQDPSFIKLKEAKDSLARIEIMGKVNYQMDRSFDVLEAAAENAGGTMSAAAGIGAGIGVGNVIGNMAAQHISTNPPSTPPPLPTAQYYLGINGQQQGPFDLQTINTKVTSELIDSDTLVWKHGMSNWMKLSEVSEFAPLFKACPPPLPQ